MISPVRRYTEKRGVKVSREEDEFLFESNDFTYEDEEFIEEGFMFFPKRADMFQVLSLHNPLMIKKLVSITKQCTRHCLKDRYKFMKETTPSEICITHSVTHNFIIWKPKNTLPKESSSKENQKL
ncbi:unnamed protein product [Cochlearia groenlandica]